MRVEMNLDIQESRGLRDDIDSRIAEFKQDPEKMSELNGFVDEVLTEAQKSAEDKLQDKSADDRPRNASLNELTAGNFRSDPDSELKCYTVCIAQMAGTLTKKGEISMSKTTAQIDAMLPTELKPFAKEAMNACKDARNKLLSGLKQHRVVTRTRGIVLRIFEAICNCTNSATLPGQRPAAGAAPTTANTATASTDAGK